MTFHFLFDVFKLKLLFWINLAVDRTWSGSGLTFCIYVLYYKTFVLNDDVSE